MKIEHDLEFRAELLKKIHDREFSERTGIHQSDLVYCLNKALFRRQDTDEIDEHLLLLYSLGWATQRWLTGQNEDEPPREFDGIVVTLDALSSYCPSCGRIEIVKSP